MIRILHVFVSLPIGGAENLLLSNLRLLEADRFQSVVCTLGERSQLAEHVEKLGVPLIELGMMSKRRGRRKIVKRLVELIRSYHIDLVHAHLFHANYLSRLAAHRVGVPCIVSIHNTYTRPKFHRRVINWWLSKRKTAAIIAGSNDIRRDILRYDHVKSALIEVIPNAVDLSRSRSQMTKNEVRAQLGIGSDAYVLGTVGRLEEQKGHRFLLGAMDLLKQRGVVPVLLLIGNGREREALLEQAESLGIMDRVHFLGMREDLGDLFRAMDLFVMPSLWEGLSLAMLTAMAAGLPVIATNAGGVTDVLGSNVRGFVVPPGESQALADQIFWCMSQKESTATIAEKGAEYVRLNYSDVAMVKRLESIYERVLRS
jgi:glycosyltransferase involved in cell wall biosynthesis